jgi:hypothetical protein
VTLTNLINLANLLEIGILYYKYNIIRILVPSWKGKAWIIAFQGTP